MAAILITTTTAKDTLGLQSVYNNNSVKSNENVEIYRRSAEECLRLFFRYMLFVKEFFQATGMDGIPVEVWKCLGEEGIDSKRKYQQSGETV